MSYVNPLAPTTKLKISIEDMVKIYESGQSMLSVGLCAGVSEGTARTVLLANAVKLRRAGRQSSPVKYSRAHQGGAAGVYR